MNEDVRRDRAAGFVAGVVDGVIRDRRSVRAFRPDPIDSKKIIEILEVAARAPSGTNIQPWKVYAVGKPMITEIAAAIAASGIRPERVAWDEYRYYPKRFVEPFLSRRRALGAALYALLGIERRDVQRMRAQFDRNFRFFDAPVGILVCIDRRLEVGSWLDLGMFIQNVLLAAEARGLATCAQAAFAPYHAEIRPIVGMPSSEILVCGIAIGLEDKTRPENSLRTDREPVTEWAKILM